MYWNKKKRIQEGEVEMEMVERAEIEENRESQRGISGGSSGKQRFRVMAFLPLVTCCVAGAATGVYLSRQRADPISRQGLTYEANAISDDIPGRTKEQRQKEPDSIMGEGVLAMSMDVTPFGKASGVRRSVNWMIEDPSNQRKLIRIKITRDDTGEKIFETGVIRLGNYLESNPLFTPLPTGEYDYTAVFPIYQGETETLIGQAAAKIKLVLRE